jgi:hypothetical protein
LYVRLEKEGRLMRSKHWLEFAPFWMVHTPLHITIPEVQEEVRYAWTNSGAGQEWADDNNGMTSADAQQCKRACGLGRYFYDFNAPWVDLDQTEPPASEDAGIAGLGDPGELAQRNAAAGEEQQWQIASVQPCPCQRRERKRAHRAPKQPEQRHSTIQLDSMVRTLEITPDVLTGMVDQGDA